MADEIQYPTPEQPVAEAPSAPIGADVNLINPEGQLVSVPATHLEEALASGYAHAPEEQVAAHFQQEQYGSGGQQAIAALEGAAQGLAGPLAPAAERALGVKAEDIRGREEANPKTHIASELAGFVAPAVLSGGGSMLAKVGVTGAAEVANAARAAEAFTQAGVLGKAGEAVAAATGLGGKGAGFVSQVGSDAIRAAFETALYQGGDELSKLVKENPEAGASSAIAHIGLAGVMGGVFGGAIGAALRKTGIIGEAADIAEKELSSAAVEGGEPLIDGTFVSAVDRPKLDAGDFETTIKHAPDLSEKQKKGIMEGLRERAPHAKDVERVAKENNLPVHPGMISASKDIQRVTSGLLEGAPTYSSLATKAVYDEGYKGANAIVEGALGAGSNMSKAEVGQAFQEALASQIKEENAPIREMYEQLKAHTEHIPLNLDTGRIVLELENMPEFRLAGSLPGGNLVKGALEGIAKAQTVDDLKVISTAVRGSLGHAATPSERRVAAIISDKLRQLEEDSIETFARVAAKTPEDKAIAEALPAARKAADAQYKPFIEKIKKLSKALGKGSVHGPQDAIQFIENLTPEQVTNRLFSKNNSQFLKFFEKEFPEQAALMRDYQRGVLREAATKEGVLSPKDLFNRINKLEPEVQEAIFSKAELKKLADAETYLRAFPKNYNPSNTSNMEAIREFFVSPVKTLSANARDLAMDKFIKTFGASPRARQAMELGKATVKGEQAATKAVRSLVSGEQEAAAPSVSEASRNKLSKLVEEYQGDPSKMLTVGDNNPVPEYAQAFATTMARAVQYLSTIKPNTTPARPLDPKPQPSAMQTAAYNRALDIAQNPLAVVQRMKQGTLIPADVTTLKAIYPEVYRGLSQKMMSNIIEAANKGKTVPYATRLQMSMFLGTPLDSTMTPAAISAAQVKMNRPQGQQQGASGAKRSTAGLDKLSTSAQTSLQSREAHRAK